MASTTAEAQEASSWPKLLTIGFMYMAQTFPAGFATSLVPTLYRKAGLPLEMFWVFSLATVPYWLRWAMAPVVDTYYVEKLGRRRSWFIPCTIAAMLAYMSLALFEPTEAYLYAIVGVLVIKSFFTTAQEIAIDAYVVDNVEAAARSKTAAINTTFETMGQLFALAGLGIVLDRFGWKVAVVFASFLMFLFLLPGFLRRERPVTPDVEARLVAQRASLKDLFVPLMRFLRRRDSWYIVPVIVTGGLYTGLLFPMIGPFLVDRGFSISQVGVMTGIVFVSATLIGATASTILCRRIGAKRVMAVLAALIVPATLPIMFVTLTGSKPGAVVTVLVLVLPTVALAAYYVTFVNLRLGFASVLQAGTDYSVGSAVSRIGQTLAGAAAGFIAAKLGWGGYFVVLVAVGVVTTLLAWRLHDDIQVMVEDRNRAEVAAP